MRTEAALISKPPNPSSERKIVELNFISIKPLDGTIKLRLDGKKTIIQRRNIDFISIEPFNEITKLRFDDGLKIIKRTIPQNSLRQLYYSRNKATSIAMAELLLYNNGENIFITFGKKEKNNNWFVLDDLDTGFFIVYPKGDVFEGYVDFINPDSSYPPEILERYNSIPFFNLD